VLTRIAVGSYRRTLTWIGVVLIVLLLFRLTPVLMMEKVFQYDDFLEYWAAGRLNLQGLNPYSAGLTSAMQQALGRTTPVMMFNPPYALPLVAPFSLLPYPVGRMLWFLASVLAIGVSAAWLWELTGGSRSRLLVVWIVVFMFSPVLGALQKGQISPFMLLGLAGFLRFERRERPWMAGAFAALTALKPHWLLPFWLVLLLWSVRLRRGKVLLAAMSTLVAATVLALMSNSAVLSHYLLTAMRDAPLAWHTPTLGGALRAWLGPGLIWLQFAPVPVGILWALIYWRRHDWDGDWCWIEHLPAITFASVLAAAYGWTYDEVVLLVALVPAMRWLFLGADRRSVIALSILGFGFNLVINFISGTFLDGAFWWLAPAWLAWCLLVFTLRRETERGTATSETWIPA